MKKTAILIDSGIIRSNDNKNKDVFVIEIPFLKDGKDIKWNSNDEIINLINDDKIKTTTSQPSTGIILKKIQEIESKGYENLIMMSISQTLSGTQNGFKIAKSMHKGKINITILNSYAVWQKGKILLDLIIDELEKQTPINEIENKFNEKQKKIHIAFFLENSTPLKNSGRIKSGTSMIANFLNIKLIGYYPPEGSIELLGAGRTKNKLIKKLFEKVDSNEVYYNEIENTEFIEELKKEHSDLKFIKGSEIPFAVMNYIGKSGVIFAWESNL